MKTKNMTATSDTFYLLAVGISNYIHEGIWLKTLIINDNIIHKMIMRNDIYTIVDGDGCNVYVCIMYILTLFQWNDVFN